MLIILVSVCVCITLVMSLAFCLCWRKKSPKNEWLGLDGMVTQKNPDENVNHLPSATTLTVTAVAPCASDQVNATSGEHNESNKRNTISTNTRRSLPDIPLDQSATAAINWEPTGDNSSGHYATVGQYQNSKRHTLPNGIETTTSARPSISQHSSISQADDTFSPYERVKYDKIKSQTEHPYAQLQPTTSNRHNTVLDESNVIPEERSSLLRVDLFNNEPIAPPRSRRSSAHSGLTVDIPAASAVAGGISASPELPYMTPPVTQANFSGDSQDSSKGYTSISVREPLANIIAQTKKLNKKHDLDLHYSTVSDDSDDVYTTIPDPNNQIYTSESETYARIPALPITVEVEINSAPQNKSQNECDDDEINDELYEPPPQHHPPLPSVDSLKQATTSHSHSRQASSSSSIGNISSPKPEKRQANSPLPPPPTSTIQSSFDFHNLDKGQIQKNLDDLYAKVNKNKRKDDSDDDDFDEQTSIERYKNKNDNIKSNTSNNGTNIINNTRNNLDSKEKCCTTISKEHNYETLRKNPKSFSEIDGKCLSDNDPGYEKIRHEEPGYASINRLDSITSSDPGYEVLKQKNPSENYEEDRTSNASDCAGYTKIKYNNNNNNASTLIDGYSVINKNRKTNEKLRPSSNLSDFSLIDDPNYETMPNESLTEHDYSTLKSNSGCGGGGGGDSESDPNYESVNHSFSNYETVPDSEPPYEQLNDNLNNNDGYEKIRNICYESIDTSESSNGTVSKKRLGLPYEQFDNDTSDSSEICNDNKLSSNQVSSIGKNESSESSNSSENTNGSNNTNLNKTNKINLDNTNNDLLDDNTIFQV